MLTNDKYINYQIDCYCIFLYYSLQKQQQDFYVIKLQLILFVEITLLDLFYSVEYLLFIINH